MSTANGSFRTDWGFTWMADGLHMDAGYAWMDDQFRNETDWGVADQG